jgi:hypothetical protein
MSDSLYVNFSHLYVLAFFYMRLAITMEIVLASDIRLRRTLRCIAGFGLIVLQRTFRQDGMARFGQDSLWVAVS